MSTLLNKQNRREFLSKLMAVAFNARVEEDIKTRNAMFMALFDDFHRKYKAAMAQLPEEYFLLYTAPIQVMVPKAAERVKLPPPPGGIRGAFNFANHEDYRCKHSLSELIERHSKAVGDKLTKVVTASVALDVEMSRFSNEASTIINSVRTTKRLYEIWPELKEFPTLVVDGVPQAKLPAPNTAELTRVLRLGKKK